MTTFTEIGAEIGALVEKKNLAYGDAINKSAVILATLFPTGIPPDKYKHALLLVRIVDKVCRIATDPTGGGEDAYVDLAGYGIRGTKEVRKEKFLSQFDELDLGLEEVSPTPKWPEPKTWSFEEEGTK